MAGNKPFNKQQAEPRERDPQVAGLKVPPHSIEAEQSVLGGLMLDNERWDDVAERVVADDFYTRPHRHIFTEMARLQESGSPIDLITLAESLERQGQLDSVGGFAYLAELSKNTPSAATKTKGRRTSPMCSTQPWRVLSSCFSSHTMALPG